MSESFTEQPIEFITKTTTMNSSDDPTALAEEELALMQNFVKDNGVFETRLGKTALNTGNLLPAAVYGLSTFDPLDSDTNQYVAVSNGIIYAGSSFPLTSKLTGLTASTLMRCLPFNGRMLVNDSSQGVAWYDGTSAGWAGVPSPRESVLIDDCESTTGTSTSSSVIITVDDSVVLHGRHGLKFKVTNSVSVLDGSYSVAGLANWTLGGGWADGTGKAAKSADGTGTLTPAVALVPVVGRVYLISYQVKDWSVGTVTCSFAGVSDTARGVDGVFSFYATAVSVTTLAFTPSATGARFSIDNVSIVEQGQVRKTISGPALGVFRSAPFGDAATSTTKDYIRFQVVRSFKADFSSVIFYLAAASWSASVTLSALDEWESNDGAGLVFDVMVRKSQFTAVTGTINWSDALTWWGVDILPVAEKQPFLIFDWVRMERSGPTAQEFGKLIADFEPNETWDQDAATLGYDTDYKASLGRSLTLTGVSAAGHRHFTTLLNLTTMENGSSSDVIDTIQLKIGRNTAKADAGELVITFTDTTGGTAHYHLSAGVIKTPKVGSAAVSKLRTKSLIFQTVQIRKEEFDDDDLLDWTQINKLTLASSAHGGVFYIDEIRLTRYKNIKAILKFEPDETAPTVTNGNNAGWADPNLNPHRSEAGSTTSFKVPIKQNVTCTIETTPAANINLAYFGTSPAEASQDSDKVGLWIFLSNPKHVKSISTYYSASGVNYTDYFYKEVIGNNGEFPNQLKVTGREAALFPNGVWIEFFFQKREHTLMPSTSTATWATIDKCKIEIVTNKSGGVTAFLDNWMLTRGDALAGTFWYAVTYKNSRGARSEMSNISNLVRVSSAGVNLTNLPTSSGHYREIWRLSELTTGWKLAGILGDDESTVFEDWLVEEELGEELLVTYTQPMIAKTLCLHGDMLIRGNLTELSGGYRHKTLVDVGIPGSFDESDPKRMIEIGKEDGFEILALVSAFDRVVVFKERGVWSFDPYNLSQKPICHSGNVGILSPFSWAHDPRGVIYFITTSKELWGFNGSSFEPEVGDPILTSQDATVRFLAGIPNSYVSKVVGEWFDETALFSIPQSAETVNSTILSFSPRDQSWSIITGWPTSIFHVKDYAGSHSLIGGVEDANGLLFTLYSGDTDNGVVISGILRTADKAPDPTITSQPATLYLTGKKLTTTDAVVTIEPYYDLTDSGDDILFTVNDATHFREEAGVPSPGRWPTYLGFKITTTLARVALRSLGYSRRQEERR
jgi:hypothetical protein